MARSPESYFTENVKMNDSLTPYILIEEYAVGRHMRVSGHKYTHDLKIIGNSVIGDWWRR